MVDRRTGKKKKSKKADKQEPITLTQPPLVVVPKRTSIPPKR